jgi:hypothetical protein
MRLEWRALARALREAGEVRLSAIRDALAFRHARHARFANMAETERALDINEGLASYTQAVLPAPSEAAAIATVVEGLAAADGTVESFVRTFAYVSGPAYGLLLDTASPGWTRRVRASDDPAALLMRAIAGPLAADAAAAAARYGGPEVRAAEERREQAPVRRDETTIAGDGWTVKAEPESWIKSGSTRLLLDGPGTEVCVTGELQDQVRPPRLVAGKRDAPS